MFCRDIFSGQSLLPVLLVSEVHNGFISPFKQWFPRNINGNRS